MIRWSSTRASASPSRPSAGCRPTRTRSIAAHSWNEREDDFTSVAFWYQMGPTKKFTEVPSAAGAQAAEPGTRSGLGQGLSKRTRTTGPGRRASRRARAIWSRAASCCSSRETQAEGWVEYTFEVKEKEPLRLLLELTRSLRLRHLAADSQRRQDRRADRSVSPAAGPVGVPSHGLLARAGQVHAASGVRRQEPTIPSGYDIGVNSVRLRERRPRVKAFGYDKDKDWRKEQVLYD